MQRISSVAVLAVWLIYGCSAIFSLYPSTFLEPAGKVEGRDVSVGRFVPEVGDGYYVALHHEGDAWRVESVAELEPAVPPGGERLFVRSLGNGRPTEVTIAFDSAASAMLNERNGLYLCSRSQPDPTEHYTPCDSSFTDDDFKASERGIDRDEVVAALQKSGALRAIDEKIAAREKYRDRVAALHALEQRTQFDFKIDNRPELIEILPGQINELGQLNGPMPNEGETAQLTLSFRALERTTAAGLVRCTLQPSVAEHAVPDRGPDDRPVIATTIVVDRCDVLHPRPQSFLAKDATLQAEITGFDATRGGVLVSVSNASREFVRISAISVEYFGKVASIQKETELPPNTVEPILVPHDFPEAQSILTDMTKARAAQKSIRFGVAVKYRGSKGETTLYRTELFSFTDLAGPSPVQ